MNKQKNIWILPMAGKGTRTSSLSNFKPFIPICGRRIVEWLLRSLSMNIGQDDILIFTTTQDFENKYEVKSNIETILLNLNIFNEWHLVICKKTPPGPAASVYEAKEYFANSISPTIIVNTDQLIVFNKPEFIANNSGFLVLYYNDSPKSSYAEINKGLISKVVEKEKISNTASAGVYAVGSGKQLAEVFERQFSEGAMVNGEYYVATAMNYLIQQGCMLTPVKALVKLDLGSINGIEVFNNFWKNVANYNGKNL